MKKKSRWGEIFRTRLDWAWSPSRLGLEPVQTGPGARPDWAWSPPSLLYNGYRVYSGVKRGADHTTSFECRGLERVELYLYALSWPHRPVIGSTLLLYVSRINCSSSGGAPQTAFGILRAYYVNWLYQYGSGWVNVKTVFDGCLLIAYFIAAPHCSGFSIPCDINLSVNLLNPLLLKRNKR
jgi:hypothetical protein